MIRRNTTVGKNLRTLAFVLPILIIPAIGIWLAVGGSTASDTSSGAIGRQQAVPVPLTLYTLGKAEQITGSTLVVPADLNSVLPGYRILGATVDTPPHIVFYDNGSLSFTRFKVTLWLWNKPFVNGTTTNLEVYQNGGILITEGSVAADRRLNATLSVLSSLAPREVCRTGTEGTVCESIPRTDGAYASSTKGQPVLIVPENRFIGWVDARRFLAMGIDAPSLTEKQLFVLAEALI